jgi:hypothetical protein
LVSAPFARPIAVGPVSVPEAVNRPQFVVRDGPNRLVVLESQRWAEPLRDGIAESVAGCLSRDLGGARVTPMTQSAASTAQLDVSLDVQRFDMIVGDAAVIEVVWTIKARCSGSAPITGRSEARIGAGTGDPYEEPRRRASAGAGDCQRRNRPTVGSIGHELIAGRKRPD